MPSMVLGVKTRKTKMKKLLTIGAIIGIACFANAAQVDWKLQTGSDYSDMKVYGISGTTAAAVLSIFQSTTESDWTDAVSGLTSYTVNVGSGTRMGAQGTTAGIASGDNLVFVIVDGAVAEGSKYWVVNDYTIQAANVYEPPATGTRTTVNFATQGTAGSGTFTAVPEPTSGLLMLLGMAGLALRRRRA